MAYLTAELIKTVQPYSKSTPARLASMCNALFVVDIDKIPGDIVECGVWRGGNIMLARIIVPERECWLYDTFNGMPEPDLKLDQKRPHDDGRPGELAIDRYLAKKKNGTKWDAVGLEEVKGIFAEMNLLDDKLHWVEGEVEETLFNQPKPKQIALLRLDMDWYWPTRTALEQLFPLLVPGGFLIIDDYGHWMGCKKAVDDYIKDKMIDETLQVDYSCVIMRKC